MARVQTVQATGKGWKLLQGIGCLGCLVGIGIIVVAVQAADRLAGARLGGAATIAFVLAVPVYLMGRVGAWWFHG